MSISWSAVSGASYYELQRQSASGTQVFQVLSGTSYADSTGLSQLAYVYKVRAARSGTDVSPYSNADLATAMTFTPASGLIAAAHFTELMTALNAIRAVSGQAGTGWAGILPAGVPAPAPGGAILATHINAMTTALNQALQALSLTTSGSPATSTGSAILAANILQLQGKAQ